jgi:hypothetical protein
MEATHRIEGAIPLMEVERPEILSGTDTMLQAIES